MSEQPAPDYLPHACVLITDVFNFIKDCRCRKTSILAAMHHLANSETGEAAPSINYLSDITGIHRPHVIQTLKELVALRKLERIGKKKGSHQVIYKVPGIPLRYFKGVTETVTLSVTETVTSEGKSPKQLPVTETVPTAVTETVTSGDSVGERGSSSSLRKETSAHNDTLQESTDKEKKLKQKKESSEALEGRCTIAANPRALGVNPRALGVNPKALGVNPRALRIDPKSLRRISPSNATLAARLRTKKPQPATDVAAEGELFDDIPQETKPILVTKKRKQLVGAQLEGFERFWDLFDDKRDKRAAADAWLELKVGNLLLPSILEGAQVYATEVRPHLLNQGKTPKMAQGWLSGRRWEDDHTHTLAKPKPQPRYGFNQGPGAQPSRRFV